MICDLSFNSGHYYMFKKQHEINCTIIFKKCNCWNQKLVEICIHFLRISLYSKVLNTYCFTEIIENKMEHIKLELELHLFLLWESKTLFELTWPFFKSMFCHGALLGNNNYGWQAYERSKRNKSMPQKETQMNTNDISRCMMQEV